MRLLLFTIFLISSCLSNSQNQGLKLAIFDTGFCLDKLKSIPANVTIHPVEDLTGTAAYACENLNPRERRYHGQMVLAHFLNTLKNNRKIDVYPLVIFDGAGKQELRYWKKALMRAKAHGANIFLAAAGHPLTVHDLKRAEGFPEIDAISFVSSGRTGPYIKAGQQLYPQILSPKDNLFIIGSYYPPLMQDDLIYDENLLYQDRIDYYFSGGKGDAILRGSSRAVATALARALNLCEKYFPNRIKELRHCLRSRQRKLMTHDKKKVLKTF